MNDELIGRLARFIDEAKHAIALTGAGVSTDSGIPDFRSSRGLWTDADPAEVASIDGFLADPVRFYRFWSKHFPTLSGAVPNVSHEVLAELGRRGRLRAIVTQNIDGLHQASGSNRVIELHGSFLTASCLACGHQLPTGELIAAFDQQQLPRCRGCGGGPIKPDAVLFGEDLPPAFADAERLVSASDLLIVLGSSLGVFPAASLVPRARAAGARVVVLNREPGPFDEDADLVIHAELGETLERLRATAGRRPLEDHGESREGNR